MAGFFSELKRRHVYQSAVIYAVAAWGLAQVIDFIAERLFMPDWVPTLTAIVFVVGFPVAIFLAWIFDIGPDGIRRTGIASVKGVGSIVAAVAMLVGGTLLVYAMVWPRHEASVSEATAAANSVAVLPFSLQGQVSGNEYLSEGVAEEILIALGTLTDLRVAARTSSFSFRGQNKTASEIARALDVRHIVEGSIRLAGDRLRVTVSLVRGDTDLELWSQSYEEPVDDIIRVQEDIAAKVADQVRQEMDAGSVGERPRFRAVSESSEAYRLYLQGRFLWHQRGADNIRSAIAFFEQALELEPEFAGAWAGLASAYLTAATYATGIADNFEIAADAAKRAIEFDATLGEPYGTLAEVEKQARHFAEAERLINEGIRLSPQNTTLRLWYATMLIQYGRSLDANRQAAIALERDPAYPILHANFAFSSFHLGRLDDAREGLEKAWNLGVKPWFMWYAILDVRVAQGDFDSAEAWFDSMPPRSNPEASEPVVDLARAWVRLAGEQTPDAREHFEQTLDAYFAKSPHGLARPAYMLAALGDGARSLDLLRQAVRDGRYIDLGQLWVPPLAAMRQQEGFSELVDALGLLDYWREVEWPDMCGPGSGVPVVCYR